MLLKSQKHLDLSSTKRGDSMIEIMFAVAVFALVAVLTIVMMNIGMTSAENSLELVTARNELNAQAEALRFIHSSYIAERTLPHCSDLTPEQRNNGEKCQQYEKLWERIVDNAMYDADYGTPTESYSIPYPLTSCNEVYENTSGGSNLLVKNKAFVINTRRLNKLGSNNSLQSGIYVSAADPVTASLFQPAPINARIIFTDSSTYVDKSDQNIITSSVDAVADNLNYTQIGRVEGLWIVAVADRGGKFYDFYIEACWYSSGDHAPTSLDAVIRLVNPQGI